jgi:hypothetical protein
MTVQVVDFLSKMPFANADVSVCEPQDVDCSKPQAHGITDTAGNVTFQFPNPPDLSGNGLDGYLQVRSPEIMTWLYYWGFPLSEPRMDFVSTTFISNSIGVLTPAEFQQYVQAVGSALDPKAGTLDVTVLDCSGSTGAGAQVMTTAPADAGAHVYYGLTGAGDAATDMTGGVEVGPIPPGTVDVTVTPLALGKPISQAHGLVIRANAVTALIAMPTPAQ